jgi:choline/glycine/proline betaine transport protein
MSVTFFHWGIHAWAIYAIMGLSLAYFGFRKGLPMTVRSAFYPLLGERIHGPLGHAVDILAVFGTLFGLATSLGLGAMQINAGLSYLSDDVPDASRTVQLVLILIITLAATASVVTGLKRGVRRLSELNGILALLLMTGVFLLGPTLFLLDSLSDNVGRYLKDVVRLSFWTHSLRDTAWRNSWTIFYWGWWIAWSPFVGMFIARISKGRTVRQFVAGCLLVPTAVTFVWLTIFGNSAIYYELFGGGGIADAVDANVSTALFELLARLPGSGLLSGLAVVVVALFFVTSSDSGSLVVDMLTSGGKTDPPVWQRVFWALSEGAVAAVLLVGGGLKALQAAAICTGLPFCALLLVVCFSLHKALRQEAGGAGPQSKSSAPFDAMTSRYQ